MTGVLLIVAICCFAGASFVDVALPAPKRADRDIGNACCSLGFLFLSIALLAAWSEVMGK